MKHIEIYCIRTWNRFDPKHDISHFILLLGHMDNRLFVSLENCNLHIMVSMATNWYNTMVSIATDWYNTMFFDPKNFHCIHIIFDLLFLHDYE